MNKQFIGWIVAGVLAVALSGVLVFQVVDDGDSRSAALGGQGQGQGGGQAPPPDVAQDVAQILAEKSKGRDKAPPELPPGQEAPRLNANPEPTCDPGLQANVFVEWSNNPQNLQQARGQADQIVVGTVTGVANAAPMVTAAPTEPGGQVETPIQTITIRVDQTLKGSARGGGAVTIEKLGDARGCYRVEGDPPYRQGEQYLLLLENGKGGRSAAHTTSPAGRYRVAADNVLQAMENNPFVSEVAGQKLEAVAAKLRG